MFDKLKDSGWNVKMNTDQIRDLCEEALSITDRYGVEDGLSFLIGENFCRQFHKLKKTQNKLKFLYPEQMDQEVLKHGDQDLKLSYALTMDENYRIYIQKVKHLENVLEIFVHEIKEYFDINDIQDYLGSYPRLGFKQKSPYPELADQEESAPLNGENILSEVEDILIIEEVKKLFL